MCIGELPDPEKHDEQVLLMTNHVFRGLVRRCLKKDSKARPTIQEIIDELSRAVLTSISHCPIFFAVDGMQW